MSSSTSMNCHDDLFKKFKLKHHRTIQTAIETDDQIDATNSDEWTSQSTTPELDVEPHFENYYKEPNSQVIPRKYPTYLLTPDIDELQRKENEIVQSLNHFEQQVNFICWRSFFSMFDFQSKEVFHSMENQTRPISAVHLECGVCHDKATGIHYGLATCEGCKGRRLNLTNYLSKNQIFQDFSSEPCRIRRNIVALEMVPVSSINLNVIVVNIVALPSVSRKEWLSLQFATIEHPVDEHRRMLLNYIE